MTTKEKWISLKTAVILAMKMTNYIVKFAAGKFFVVVQLYL